MVSHFSWVSRILNVQWPHVSSGFCVEKCSSRNKSVTHEMIPMVRNKISALFPAIFTYQAIIYLFSKYFLHVYYIPGTGTTGTENKAVNKINQVPMIIELV